ncbi:hypothetical protein V8E54_006980 [Elaphomyces granulatus]
MGSASDVHPARKILAVVTVGGSSNSAPILEICQILAQRGHAIEFATLKGREELVQPYSFVSTVHIVDRTLTAEEDEQLYLQITSWNHRTYAGRRDIMRFQKFLDSFWPETYRGLKKIVESTRPDFIFTDYQSVASRDIAAEYCIPVAAMWPQMPWFMAPQKWIPGVPGFQVRCLTSEHASMYDRLFEQSFILRWAPNFIDIYYCTRKMRRAAGVKTMPFMKLKPDYLVFVNSFFGLEPSKDLPPLIHAAGPILSDEWKPLEEEHESFLRDKKSVAYVAFGSHLILRFAIVEKILEGLADAMRDGYIDGVVWGMRAAAQNQILHSIDLASSPMVSGIKVVDLVQNKNPAWLFLEYAPQRGLLEHHSIKLFLTHAGASSANEGLYHGVPMLSMAINADQIQNSLRLVAAGVALGVDKHDFSALEIFRKVEAIIQDPDHEIQRNVRRMQRIAHVTCRRKHLAADLVEEHMYDWDLRFELTASSGLNCGRGKMLSPMHLQTADARISWLKATNTDQWLIVLGICAFVGMLWRFGPFVVMAGL